MTPADTASPASPILVTAHVPQDERLAMAAGIDMANRAITAASPGQPRLSLRLDASPASIHLMSLRPALDDLSASIEALEHAWLATLAAQEAQRVRVLLCNLFRHVPDRTRSSGATAMLTRIRELNLLAVRLSHRTGISVVDVDRVMAGLGARSLASDYRLGGTRGAGAAGYAVAHCLLRCGLDDFIAADVLERALQRLGPLRSVPNLLSHRERAHQEERTVHG